MGSWRRTFVSGLVFLTPIIVIAALASWAYWTLAGLPVFEGVRPEAARPPLIAMVLVLFTFSLGYLMRTTLGLTVDRQVADAVTRVPGLGLVYGGLKATIEGVAANQAAMRRPVKVETWSGMWMIAFRTGRTTPGGRELVFIPGSPDPTSGLVVDVDPADVVEADESLSEAVVRIVSCGFGDVRADRAEQ